MKFIPLSNTTLSVPAIIIGCMRLNQLTCDQAERFIQQALELGLNFFDHADIYGKGECESLFAKATHFNADAREKVIIQSKCSIRKGLYDFSKSYILSAVDNILKRLDTPYLDTLLLHRPDALFEPEEVAEAFNALASQGKVRYFGVSNQNPMTIELLQRALSHKLIINQLQFSPAHCGMISQNINVNMTNASSNNRDGEILNYCRLNNITLQAWSPFQYGMIEGTYLGNKDFYQLNQTLTKLANLYNVTEAAIVIAWILRHPANMQVVVGTMNNKHLQEISQGTDITLTREQWYEIYQAAGNSLP